MTMPIDLVLVRHGQSEGNKAKRLAERGDNSAYTDEFRNRHTSSFRLTEAGRNQAAKTGEWIRDNLGRFDKYFTSEYDRAMETAALLQIPGADWFASFYLGERDWGEIDLLSPEERQEKFGEALRRRDIEPFFWAPTNGESFAKLCLRIDRVLDTLHRECSDKRVIIVCHGEVMWAFRVLLERMPQRRFKELHLSKNQNDRIYNCQIIHYSRRDPESGKLDKYANWMRLVRPTATPVWNTGWTAIKRPTYSNEALLEIVSQSPALLS
jgi:NAD+ kinase